MLNDCGKFNLENLNGQIFYKIIAKIILTFTFSNKFQNSSRRKLLNDEASKLNHRYTKRLG